MFAGDAQALLHDRAGGRVLQELALLRKQMVLNGECRQRRLMKAAQYQLLLARIGVDVADREDARHVRLKPLRIDAQRTLFQVQSPLGNRPELRMQAEEG